MSPHPVASNSNRGFTLIEALVSLTLLTVGLIPAFMQASNAIALSGSVRNSLIASNLAVEGVEVVRSIRDANWFASAPFNTGLDTCSGGCRVQWDSSAVMPPVGNPPLKFDPLSGLYQYATGTNTLFTRSITIATVSDHELRVQATIEWRERSGDKTFTLEYHLYDWLQ
jgi:prepilin-type N-terminal cleavage/methylation domain-containing protein